MQTPGPVSRPAPAFAILLLLLGGTDGLSAQAPTLEQVAWLTGCWARESGARRVEETWLPARGGAMLNVGRTIREGRMVDHEFVILRAEGGGLAYEAHPAGQASATFRAAEASESLVVFRDPTHDFPQAVGYRRIGSDSLLAWIEGTMEGKERRIEFPYHRESCDAH